jgi:hypothetical protein
VLLCHLVDFGEDGGADLRQFGGNRAFVLHEAKVGTITDFTALISNLYYAWWF